MIAGLNFSIPSAVRLTAEAPPKSLGGPTNASVACPGSLLEQYFADDPTVMTPMAQEPARPVPAAKPAPPPPPPVAQPRLVDAMEPCVAEVLQHGEDPDGGEACHFARRMLLESVGLLPDRSWELPENYFSEFRGLM